MINCAQCVKQDVCKLTPGINEKIQSLEVSKEYQALNQFKVDINCGFFMQNQQPKIIKNMQ